MPVTVALTRLPELLADMVREAFVDDPSVSVETLRTAGDECLDAAIGREMPDMVIVGVDADGVAGDRVVPCDLLLGYPGLTVLGLSTDGRLAWMCELRPSARPLQEVSPTSLRKAVHLALRGWRR